MYVVVKGDFRFGVTDVIGPFETEDEIWESELDNVFPDDVYPVSPMIGLWCVGTKVSIEFERSGKISKVYGPCGPLWDSQNPYVHPFSLIGVQSVNHYMGIEDVKPTTRVLHKEHLHFDVVQRSFIKTEEYVDVPVVEEKDLLSPKADILREVVISKQKDRWGLDNSVMFVDARSLYAG